MNRRTGLFLMIGLSAAAAAIGASAMAFTEPEVKKAKLGKKAPEFTLLDTSGQERSLSDYKGKTVVLEWFNLGCPFVQRCYKSKAMQDAYMKSK
ncbi:MAG: redoxin domain-containing protein, partial [Planctomycetota bacterium]|nr:redoxin domain-containing protein [Planctomycetota bacterium]